MKASFVPGAGDFVWLTFDPQAGRELAGRRPALVLSPRTYNERSGLALACPIASQAKGLPLRGGRAGWPRRSARPRQACAVRQESPQLWNTP